MQQFQYAPGGMFARLLEKAGQEGLLTWDGEVAVTFSSQESAAYFAGGWLVHPDRPGPDRDAVDRLMERHRQSLERMVRGRLNRAVARRVDASDVVQETLLTASKRMAEYEKTHVAPEVPGAQA